MNQDPTEEIRIEVSTREIMAISHDLDFFYSEARASATEGKQYCCGEAQAYLVAMQKLREIVERAKEADRLKYEQEHYEYEEKIKTSQNLRAERVGKLRFNEKPLEEGY